MICTTVTEYAGHRWPISRTNHLQEQLVNNETTKKVMRSRRATNTIRTGNEKRIPVSYFGLWILDQFRRALPGYVLTMGRFDRWDDLTCAPF